MELLMTLFVLFIIGLVISKFISGGKSGVSKNNSFNHTSTHHNQFYGTESIDNGRHDRHDGHHDHGGHCDHGGWGDSGGGDSGGGGGCD